jgi:hypothetical protein
MHGVRVGCGRGCCKSVKSKKKERMPATERDDPVNNDKAVSAQHKKGASKKRMPNNLLLLSILKPR